jgi:putative addiction module component (TIGR02574 family)
MGPERLIRSLRPHVFQELVMSSDISRWIASDAAAMIGKPVIAGTRVTIESIFERFEAGESIDQLKQAFPDVPEAALDALWKEFTSPLDEAWMAEIRRRSAELDEGKVAALPWDEVREQIRTQIFGRKRSEARQSGADGPPDGRNQSR